MVGGRAAARAKIPAVRVRTYFIEGGGRLPHDRHSGNVTLSCFSEGSLRVDGCTRGGVPSSMTWFRVGHPWPEGTGFHQLASADACRAESVISAFVDVHVDADVDVDVHTQMRM